MSAERPADQRLWAAVAHACVLFSLPFCLYIAGMWRYSMPHFLPLLPLAPLVSYLIYFRSRRRPEREWLAFHALQAAMLQFAILLLVFAVPPGLWVAYNALTAVMAVVIAYGLVGAVATYSGRDFTYVGLGRLAERIMRRPPRQP